MAFKNKEHFLDFCKFRANFKYFLKVNIQCTFDLLYLKNLELKGNLGVVVTIRGLVEHLIGEGRVALSTSVFILSKTDFLSQISARSI